jgi:hypothetical protein
MTQARSAALLMPVSGKKVLSNPGDPEAFSSKIIEEIIEGRPTRRSAA